MSSSGLIYAVIVGAWAAYLVPMWLRRQDELNEARPTERFSTAIRLLSGRAGMERRYARDLRARSTQEGEPDAVDPDAVTDSVDVRAFAVPPTRLQAARERGRGIRRPRPGAGPHPRAGAQTGVRTRLGTASAQQQALSAQTAAARAPALEGARTPSAHHRDALPRLHTPGAIVAAVGGLAFLWVPGVPAVLLSAYIAYLRTQERRRFAYQMDRRHAEAAAQRLRERQPHRRAPLDADPGAEETADAPDTGTDTGLSALAADRRALVEQTDHAEWVDQQRERQRRPGHGDSWDPVPVPLPTYVTAPVAPRATSDVDLGAPDTWSSARSSAVAPEHEAQAPESEAEPAPAPGEKPAGGHGDARRAASARRARERGRTPLFDQYEDGDRPRAANE